MTKLLSSRTKKYMSIAKRISLNSLIRFRVGAVLVKRNNVLSVAYNIRKTHPKFGSGNYQTLHAEGHALCKALRTNKNINNATIYIYRNNGNLAKPCPCCQKLLDTFNIKAIYSDGTTDDF